MNEVKAQTMWQFWTMILKCREQQIKSHWEKSMCEPQLEINVNILIFLKKWKGPSPMDIIIQLNTKKVFRSLSFAFKVRDSHPGRAFFMGLFIINWLV